MAEIKIEKKKPVWPWVLLFLLLLAIVAFFVYQNQSDDGFSDDVDMVDDMNDTIDVDTTTYNNSATYDIDENEAMTALMEAMKDSTRFGTDSTFTKTSLYNLAKLTVAKAKSNMIESSSSLSDLEQYANMTSTNNGSMASEFKSVSEDVVNVIEAILKKQNSSDTAVVSNLKEIVGKLSDSNALAEQQKTIQTFFRQVHDVIHKINS